MIWKRRDKRGNRNNPLTTTCTPADHWSRSCVYHIHKYIHKTGLQTCVRLRNLTTDLYPPHYMGRATIAVLLRANKVPTRPFTANMNLTRSTAVFKIAHIRHPLQRLQTWSVCTVSLCIDRANHTSFLTFSWYQ